MALAVTPVPRNLATKVTFLYLEFEDLFVILGLAVVMNMFGRFLQREMFGIPMNVFLQYVVPVLSIFRRSSYSSTGNRVATCRTG